MISRSTRRYKKALQVRSLQEGKLIPFLPQGPSHSGHRWLSSYADDLDTISSASTDLHQPINIQPKVILPVQARSKQRPQSTNRKPFSLPVAVLPVEIEQLVNVVRRKGQSPDLEKHLDALSISLTAYHVANTLRYIDNAESAIRFLAWASEQPKFCHNSYTCAMLVTILARSKQFDKIWELLFELHASGIELEDALFNITIKAYGKMGNGKEAVRTLHRMKDFGVSPTAYSYNTLLSVLLKSHQLNSALEVYRELLQVPDVRENVFSHGMMISALCEAGRVEEAYKIVMEGSEKGVPHNNFSWTSLINGFCKAGNIEKALELLAMMKDMGLEPNVVTYSSIIAGFSKLGKLNDALGYLDRMQSDGIRPNAITYVPLLDAFCKAGRIDEGHELWKKVSEEEKRGNTIQYSMFVIAYAKSGRMDEACGVYNEMLKHGCSPNVGTYGTFIQGLCKAGRLKEALRVLEEMRERTCGPNVAIYKVMVEALSIAGYTDQAGKLSQEMLEEGYEGKKGTYKGLIRALCKQGSQTTAKELLMTI